MNDKIKSIKAKIALLGKIDGFELDESGGLTITDSRLTRFRVPRGIECLYGYVIRLMGTEGEATCYRISADQLMDKIKLEILELTDSLKLIDDSAFKSCVELKEVIVKNGVEVIEDNAFTSCGKLSKFDFVTSIKKIGEQAFGGCAFEVIDLSKCCNIVKIEKQAFYYNKSLKKVILNNNTNEISDRAFSGCENLEEINLENIDIIGDDAFDGCTKLLSNSYYKGIIDKKSIKKKNKRTR